MQELKEEELELVSGGSSIGVFTLPGVNVIPGGQAGLYASAVSGMEALNDLNVRGQIDEQLMSS